MRGLTRQPFASALKPILHRCGVIRSRPMLESLKTARSLRMPHPEVVHIAPAANDWRLHRTGAAEDLFFHELGDALDAASSLAAEGLVIRIVVHQAPGGLDAESAPNIGPRLLAIE
jgi:hypothetical protein